MSANIIVIIIVTTINIFERMEILEKLVPQSLSIPGRSQGPKFGLPKMPPRDCIQWQWILLHGDKCRAIAQCPNHFNNFFDLFSTILKNLEPCLSK